MDAMEIELLLNPELVQLLPNWDELNAQWVSKKYFTVGGPFLRPLFFARALFLHDFRRFLGAKKGHSRISEEKMTKISDFVFFIWVIFLQKREIFAYFCLYFQICYALTPGANATQGPWGKFGLFNALVPSRVHLASFRSGQNRTLLVYFCKNNKVFFHHFRHF